MPPGERRLHRDQLQQSAEQVDKLLLTAPEPPLALVSMMRGWMAEHSAYRAGAGAHRTTYRPDRWAAIEPWPCEMPRSESDTTPISQSRDDVTHIAERCHKSGSWLELMVAVVVWGHRQADYGSARLLKMLECGCHGELPVEQRLDRLASAASILDIPRTARRLLRASRPRSSRAAPGACHLQQVPVLCRSLPGRS